MGRFLLLFILFGLCASTPLNISSATAFKNELQANDHLCPVCIENGTLGLAKKSADLRLYKFNSSWPSCFENIEFVSDPVGCVSITIIPRQHHIYTQPTGEIVHIPLSQLHNFPMSSKVIFGSDKAPLKAVWQQPKKWTKFYFRFCYEQICSIIETQKASSGFNSYLDNYHFMTLLIFLILYLIFVVFFITLSCKYLIAWTQSGTYNVSTQ